jgi:hypothetical protein
MLSDEDVLLDLRTLMKRFAKKKVKEKKKQTDADEEEDGVDKVVTLLEPKRQRNVGIAIARYKLDPVKIKGELLMMDFGRKDRERLELLMKHAPTADEVELLQQHEATPNLGKVERFFVDVMAIPNYTARVESALFRGQFDDMRLELQNDIELVSSALEQVEDSICLKRMLEVVLALGNYLNGGTVRGGAHGFRLETLLKLQSIKSTDNAITLLNYLAELLSSDPDQSYVIEDLADELDKLAPSARIGLDMLMGQSNVIRKGLRLIERQLRDLKGHEGEGDNFVANMGPFALEAKEALEELDTMRKEVEASFKRIVRSLGEDEDKLECGDKNGMEAFFEILHLFQQQVVGAYRANERKKEQEAAAIRKKEEEVKRKESLAQKRRDSRAASAGGGGQGATTSREGMVKSLSGKFGWGSKKKMDKGGEGGAGGGGGGGGGGASDVPLRQRRMSQIKRGAGGNTSADFVAPQATRHMRRHNAPPAGGDAGAGAGAGAGAPNPKGAGRVSQEEQDLAAQPQLMAMLASGTGGGGGMQKRKEKDSSSGRRGRNPTRVVR